MREAEEYEDREQQMREVEEFEDREQQLREVEEYERRQRHRKESRELEERDQERRELEERRQRTAEELKEKELLKKFLVADELEQKQLEAALRLSLEESKRSSIDNVIDKEENEESLRMKSRRKLISNQDEAFYESLRRDEAKEKSLLEGQRKKEEEQEREEEMQQEEYAIQLSKELSSAKRISELQARIPTEPQVGVPIAKLCLRFPNGEKMERKFFSEDKVQSLRDFVELKLLQQSEGNISKQFEIRSDFPIKTYGQLDQTFKEAGLTPSCVVSVQFL